MPILDKSSYTAPLWLPGGHIQTIYPVLARRVPHIRFSRFRLDTPDHDFILVDHALAGKRQGGDVAILSHGIEGNSRRKYIRGMCKALLDIGWDCMARNCRCCGGEINRTCGMYHSGQTEDIHTLTRHALSLGYERIFLIGFSMGGNQTLKYLGENPGLIPPEIIGAAAISVPCDLYGCAEVLDSPYNRIYMANFLRTLRQKIARKHLSHPKHYPLERLAQIHTFREFDDTYTSPLYGFASAEDYWTKASCIRVLGNISVPALILNARNDPFLSPSCYPFAIAEKSKFIHLETPDEGGHVGFTTPIGEELYWSEKRVMEFLRQSSG